MNWMCFALLEKMCERNESRDFVLFGKTRRATSLFQSHIITCLLEIHEKTIAESTYVRLTSSSHKWNNINLYYFGACLCYYCGKFSRILKYIERDQWQMRRIPHCLIMELVIKLNGNFRWEDEMSGDKWWNSL